MKILGYDIRFDRISNLDKKAPERYQIIKRVIEQNKQRGRETLATWRVALQEAENIYNPNRERLLRIFRDVRIDLHITSQIDSRKLKTLNKDFKVCNKEGEENTDLTKLFEASWFMDFVDLALDADYEGFSLVQFGDIKDDKFQTVELVDRDHVKPEFGIFTINKGDQTGLEYGVPPFSNWSIFVGKKRDLGLLMKIAPIFIYKKWCMAAWSEFCEVYGMPVRTGKTNVRDETLRANMEAMLRDMGTNTWGVFDTDDLIEFHESKNSNSGTTVYEGLIRYCDELISKAVQGQTGTSDQKSYVGAAEVHEEVSQDYAKYDQKRVQFLVNDKLIPLMRNLGFVIPEDHYFKYDYSEKVSMVEQSEIDLKISQMGFNIEEGYITEKYGTPVTKKEEEKPVDTSQRIKALYNRV